MKIQITGKNEKEVKEAQKKIVEALVGRETTAVVDNATKADGSNEWCSIIRLKNNSERYEYAVVAF